MLVKSLNVCAAFCCGMLASAIVTPAGAADDSSQAAPANGREWVVTLGASVEYGPRYPGSGRFAVGGMPSFDIRRFDEAATPSAPDDNLDFGIVSVGGFEAGPVIGLRDGRSVSDDSRLVGLRKVKWGVDAGVFAQYWLLPERWRVRTEVRQALSNGSGLVADLGMDWFQPAGDGLMFSVGPRASFGSGSYMKRYFGVSPQEAAANGSVGTFDANAGLKSVGVTVAASYDFAPSWTAQAYYRYDRLVGDAAASPIVKQFGTPDQHIFGLSLSKSFSVGF